MAKLRGFRRAGLRETRGLLLTSPRDARPPPADSRHRGLRARRRVDRRLLDRRVRAALHPLPGAARRAGALVLLVVRRGADAGRAARAPLVPALPLRADRV